MIVFGHNNFVIKRYSFQDLGIQTQQDSSNIELQVRQRYSHLFWIPFFPIGKLWIIKKANDESLYEMPVELQNAIIDKFGRPGTPWYSFALIVIGLVIGFFTLLGSVLDEVDYENRSYNKGEEIRMFIKFPTTGDYYIFKHFEQEDRYSNSTKMILKVKSYNDSKTQFISLYPELYKDADYQDAANFIESFDLAESYNYNPTYIDKKALELVLEDYKDNWKKPTKLEPLEGYYVLEEVRRRDLDKE